MAVVLALCCPLSPTSPNDHLCQLQVLHSSLVDCPLTNLPYIVIDVRVGFNYMPLLQ